MRYKPRPLWVTGNGKTLPWPVLNALADIYVNIGCWDKAISIYDRSLPTLEHIGDHKALGQCLTEHGHVHMLKGDYKEAETLARMALALGGEVGDRALRAKARNLLGNVANNKGCFGDSVEHYLNALQQWSAASPDVDRCALMKNLGVAYYEMGDYSKAVDCQQRALALAEADGKLLEIGAIHLNLGIIRHRQRDHGGALEFFHQALAMLGRIGHKDLVRKVHNYLGIVHSDLGRLDLALAHYDESLALARELGDRSGLATILNNLGSIHLNRGDYQKAAGYFSDCRRLFQDMGHEEGVAVAGANLGEVYKELGDYPESDRLYSSAVDYGRKQQAKYFLCHFLAGIADLRMRQGLDGEAVSLADEAVELANELNIPDVSFSCRLLDARLTAKQNIPGGLLKLRRLSEDFNETEKRAEASYWLYRFGGRDEDRSEALESYMELDSDPENRLIKDKIRELQNGG